MERVLRIITAGYRKDFIINKFYWSMLLLIGFAAPLWAMDKEAAPEKEGQLTYRMPEVVVTDTKMSQPQERVTQKITVFHSDQIGQQTTPQRNISELLQYDSGQFVNPLSRNDANWGSFGGMGPKYNGYLLDGMPIDSFVDGMSLDPWAFDRVEVYKGPAAVMYSNYLSMDFAGNEAPLTGVTNFLMKDKIDKPMTRILLGGGSYRTMNGRVYHQDRKGDFNYFFGANYEKSDYTNYGTPGSWLNMLKNPEYEKTKIYAKGTYLFGRDNHKLSFFVNHTGHTGDVGRPNRDFNNSYDTINAAYSNQLNDSINLQVKTGYRNYDRRWAEDNFPTNLNLREHDGVKQQVIPSDITVNIKHAGNSILTAGADSQFATYKTYAETSGLRSTGNDVTASSMGLFLQEKYVLDKWVLRLGGRYNYTHHSYDLISGGAPGIKDQSWNKLLWSTGVRYNAFKQLAFFSNVGSSFVAPSAKSVGGTLKASDIGVAGKNGQLPNPGLRPESGIGSDLGMEIRPTDAMTISIRGFLNQVDDMIVDNVVSNNPSQSQSVNAGKARSYGFELALDHYLSNNLQWFANFTQTSTDIQNSLDPDQDGSEVSFVPNYEANVGLSAKLPYAVTISPYLHAVGKYYDSSSKSGRSKFGPYEVVNVKLQKLLVQRADYKMNLAIDLNNVTNRQYEMPWQFMNPGFNFFSSIEFNF